MSFLDVLQEYVYIRFVLKLLGIVMFGLAFLASWNAIHWPYKMLMIFGVLAFFVGMRYDRIYRP